MSEHFTNAVKTSLACLIGFLVADFFKLESKQWVLITIIVVMTTQTSVGGALQKSYLRFLGTIVGALIAMLTVIFFKGNVVVVNSIVVLSVFVFSYLVALSAEVGQAWSLGAVTVTIILLSKTPNLHFAGLRLIEILSGIIIALVVNIAVFPISATKKLKKLLAENLKISESYYQSIFDGDNEKCHVIEKEMMNNFMRAQKLFEEAKVEPGIDKKCYLDILFHEKRLFRAINLLEHYLEKNPDQRKDLERECSFISDMLMDLHKKMTSNKKLEIILDESSPDILEIKKENFFAHFIFDEISTLVQLVGSAPESNSSSAQR